MFRHTPGSNCEVNLDDCKSQPCDYGRCIDKINGYECACEPGYTGEWLDGVYRCRGQGPLSFGRSRFDRWLPGPLLWNNGVRLLVWDRQPERKGRLPPRT